MYKVELHHYKPCYRRGDLEATDELERAEVFKTRKAAKDWILRQVRGKSYKERWHKGKEPSYVWYYTDYKWVHENTGEECQECFTYTLTKK